MGECKQALQISVSVTEGYLYNQKGPPELFNSMLNCGRHDVWERTEEEVSPAEIITSQFYLNAGQDNGEEGKLIESIWLTQPRLSLLYPPSVMNAWL